MTEPQTPYRSEEVECPHCGHKELEKYVASGMVTAKCKRCRQTWQLGFHAPGEVSEHVVIPKDGSLPYVKHTYKGHLKPATTKKMEFER